MHDYVTPQDMKELYEQAILIQATNYSDRAAKSVNMPSLEAACKEASSIVDGYLLLLGIAPNEFSSRFKAILKIHAGRLAMDYLAGTDPQIREMAKETIKWLEGLAKMTKDQIKNLIGDPIPDPEPEPVVDTAILPQVSFTAGRCWSITF